MRPTVMDVNLNALKNNFECITNFVNPALVMPVVKANAYGHGAVECANQLVSCGAKYLGVALVEEGIELRQAGINIPILVFGGIFGSQIGLFLDYNLDLTASSISKLQAIDEVAKARNTKARVHLKIDTGMGRIGVRTESSHSLFEVAIRSSNVDIVGVFSHFATAADDSSNFVSVQLERFLESVSFFERRSLPMPIRHISSSASLFKYPNTHLDMVRPGLCLYGVFVSATLPDGISLQPVMSLKSKVVYFKVVSKGTGISYSHTWTAPNETRIVTIPVGYGDGFFRRLSNCGSVLIRGKRYPIVGNVCMDQMMVDIGQDEAYNGDEVVLIGSQGKENISVEEIAELVDTTPHEVLVSTNMRVPRRYIKTTRQ